MWNTSAKRILRSALAFAVAALLATSSAAQVAPLGPSGAGGVSVSDGVTTVSPTSALTFGSTFCVASSGSGNAQVNSCANVAIASGNYSTSATDMGKGVCLSGSGNTITLSAKSAGPNMWQAGQTWTVSDCGLTGSETLTNSSTLAIRGLPGPVQTLASGNSTSIYPGFTGMFVADSDATHIDCVGCTGPTPNQWPEVCFTLGTSAATKYCPAIGAGTAGSSAPTVDQALGRSTIFTDIWVNLTAAPTSTNTHTFKISVNGSTTNSPTCQIATSATSCHGSGGTITGTAGQLVHIEDAIVGTPAASNAEIGSAWYSIN